MKLAELLSKKMIAFATSTGSPRRSKMWYRPQMGSHRARSPPAAFETSGVHIQPGLTAFTRTPRGARSKAWHLVISTIAAFVALYVQRFACAMWAEILPTFTMAD